MSDGSDEEPRAREVIGAIADQRVIERAFRRASPPYRLPAPPRSPGLRVHVEPEAWRAGFVRVDEREVPSELIADLRELTPQALLRDLHRPVLESVWHERELIVEPLDHGGRAAWAELRRERNREPLPRVPSTSAAIREEQLRRRAFLAERWQPTLPDDAPRKAIDDLH